MVINAPMRSKQPQFLHFPSSCHHFVCTQAAAKPHDEGTSRPRTKDGAISGPLPSSEPASLTPCCRTCPWPAIPSPMRRPSLPMEKYTTEATRSPVHRLSAHPPFSESNLVSVPKSQLLSLHRKQTAQGIVPASTHKKIISPRHTSVEPTNAGRARRKKIDEKTEQETSVSKEKPNHPCRYPVA